jgi:hypothetical protein
MLVTARNLREKNYECKLKRARNERKNYFLNLWRKLMRASLMQGIIFFIRVVEKQGMKTF